MSDNNTKNSENWGSVEKYIPELRDQGKYLKHIESGASFNDALPYKHPMISLFMLFKDAEPVYIERDGEPFTRFTIATENNKNLGNSERFSFDFSNDVRFINNNDKLTLEFRGNYEKFPVNILKHSLNINDSSPENPGHTR